MSICDDQYEKFGESCKWLEDDDMFHATICLKQLERRRTLFDRFDELGFKHPEVAYYVVNVSCLANATNDFKCFDKSDKSNHIVLEDMGGLELTETEKEAVDIAENEFNDNEYVKKIYRDGKAKMIAELKEKAENEMKKTVAIENDENI